MKQENVIENKFFDRTSRNNQIEELVKNIGGVKVLKARNYTSVNPFIYNDDRTEFKLHYDDSDNNIYGLQNFIECLNIDSSSDNYLVRLAPILIKGADPSKVYSLFIIDLDNHNENDKTSSGYQIFKEIYKTKFDFPSTLTIKTKRGGFHLYYYIEIEILRKLNFNKKIGFEKGIDLLSSMNKGGLHTIIGPGSQAYNKEKEERLEYKIINSIKIAPLPISFIEHLKITYADSNKELNAAKEAVALIAKAGIKEDEPQNIREAEAYINKIILEALEIRAIDPGSDPFRNKRNDKLNAVAYRLSSFGLSLRKIKELLTKVNNKAFISPIEEYEFNRTAESAYKARISKNEAFENAQHTIPEFPPYQRIDGIGERVIGYDEVIERLNARPKIPLKEQLKTEVGIRYFADTCFIASGTIVQLTKKKSESIFIEANELLNSTRKLTFSDISRLLDKIELQFQVFTQESKFCLNVGPVPYKSRSKKGQGTTKLTNNPIFEQRVTSGLRKDFIRPVSNNIVEHDIFHQVAPPPIGDFPLLSKEEMEKAQPIINTVLEHFKNTITNPNESDEMHFLINRIAAMIQRKQNIPNFIVLYGAGGTGKSTFLQFLALFFASTDRLNASKFDDITSRFSNPGELTLLDDCNLAKASQWDTIKSLVSASEITIEEKGGPTVNIRKHVNMFLCTNKKIPEIEKLSDRRMYLLKGYPKYNAEQFLSRIDIITRTLLANDLFGLRALYQFFLTYNVTISDWNQKSRAQQDMITEMSNYQSSFGGVSAIIQSDRIQQQKNEERHKYRKTILNAIVNFGYIHEDSKLDKCKLKLIDSENYDLSYLINNVYDVGFMLNYYNYLSKDKILTGDIYFTSMEKDMSRKITALTKSIVDKTSVFSEIIGDGVDSPINKKLTSKYSLKRNEIGQKRKMILPPISQWIDRACFLVGDSMSTQISYSFLAEHGLEDICNQILHWNEDHYIPSFNECEETLLEFFPNTELGKFDLTEEIGEISSFEFEKKDEDTW